MDFYIVLVFFCNSVLLIESNNTEFYRRLLTLSVDFDWELFYNFERFRFYVSSQYNQVHTFSKT